MTLLQTGLVAETPIQLLAQLLGLGFASTIASGLVAVGYRWYVRERVPTGLAVLFGLTVISVYLGTTGSLGQAIAGQETAIEVGKVVPNLAAFAVGAAGSAAGIRIGDAIGTDISAATGEKTTNADVSEIVQTVGRVTPVRLPEEIDDIVGYDPMPEKTKQTLENRRFLFPRRLTKSDLRDRLVARLKTDYGVGHVDIELADDGTVEYIAIGSRAAGIGPTLPPSTNAVAIRADPAHAASSGDIVQVWSTEPLERVLTGELRGVTDDVVTIAIDAADTSKLDQTTQYKLVTLPVQDRPDREFASLLRAADETMGTITVGAGTELEGTTVSELDVAVMAITRDGSQPEPIPAPDRTLSAGDVIYAIARPEALRRAEAAASRVRAEPTDELTAAETAPATATQPAANTDAGSDVPAPESAAESDDSDTDEPTPDDAEQEISEPSTAEPGVEDSVTEAMESDTAESDAVEADSDEPTEIRTALEKLSESDIESSVGPTIADGDIDGLSDSNTDPSESPESDTDGSTGTPPDLEEFVAEPDATDQHDQETQEQSEQETASDSDETVQIWDPEERLEAIESDDTKETDESQN